MVDNHRGSVIIHPLKQQSKGKKMKATRNSEAIAQAVVNELITALHDRQEARGEHRDSISPYQVGYIGSILSTILAESPKHRRMVLDSIALIKETK
jgi:hypothetical protein